MDNREKTVEANKEVLIDEAYSVKPYMKKGPTKAGAFWGCVGITAFVDGVNLLVGILGMIAVAAIIGTRYGHERLRDGEFVMTSYLNHAYTFTTLFMVISFLAIYIVLRVKKVNVRQEIKMKKIPLKVGLIYILFIPLAYSLSLFTNNILDLLSKFIVLPGLERAQEISNMNSNPLWYKLLAVALVAPFFEEFVFRGVIQNKLNKVYGISIVIIVQAILFGVYHMNLTQGVYAMILGLVFGYFVHAYQTIWPGIIMHMTINSLSVIGAHFYADEVGIAISVNSNLLAIGSGLGGLLLCGALLIYFQRFSKPTMETEFE